jgi:hypothetical protein
MTTLDDPTRIPDPSTVPMRPTAVRHGLIAALALVVLSLIYNMAGMIDYTGEKSNMLPNILNWAVMIGALVMAIKHHRDNELGGYITFGRCVSMGALMGLIIGAVMGVFSLVYFNLIDPGLVDNIMGQMEERFAEQGLDENASEIAMKWTRGMFSPIGLILLSLISSLITMVIISLIVGAIMKKNPPANV